MLKTERNSRNMEKRVLRAFHKASVGGATRDNRAHAVFEHGQWRITMDDGAQFSVCDAIGGSTVDGFDFERRLARGEGMTKQEFCIWPGCAAQNGNGIHRRFFEELCGEHARALRDAVEPHEPLLLAAAKCEELARCGRCGHVRVTHKSANASGSCGAAAKYTTRTRYHNCCGTACLNREQIRSECPCEGFVEYLAKGTSRSSRQRQSTR